MDMIAVNNPSEVLVLLPADLKDGTYEPATDYTILPQFADNAKNAENCQSIYQYRRIPGEW